MRAVEDIEKSEAGFASGGFCKRTAETHVLFSQANPPVSEKQIKLESERCPPPTAGSWGGAAVAADARWGCGGGRAVLRPLPDVRTATGRCAARAGTGSKASAVQAKPAGAPSAALNPAVRAGVEYSVSKRSRLGAIQVHQKRSDEFRTAHVQRVPGAPEALIYAQHMCTVLPYLTKAP